MITNKLKLLNWNNLTPFKKHMILMYLYRTETDLSNINDYVETQRFREIGIQSDTLPENILNLSVTDKRKMAYAVIGKEPV